MKEIGGYIEFEHYNRPMLHDDGIKLNCGRNALAYIIEVYGIKKIVMPKFMCDSCNDIFMRYNIDVRYYSVGLDFKPVLNEVGNDEWLYVVNFYGQLTKDYFLVLKENYKLIIDNSQAYFDIPIDGIPTLYTCRKFFGVSDGAILYSDKKMNVPIQDESFERMHFLMGRFERSASEFYSEYISNNRIFASEIVKKMSALTENLLRSINYEEVRRKRKNNFTYLEDNLHKINKLKLTIPEGPFMYPLYLSNGYEIRKNLQENKIFIPTLWPAVFDICSEDEIEYDMAKNILPIPIDQRYGIEDMEYMVEQIKKFNKR